MNSRQCLKDKKRIVVKIGSSSLFNQDTHKLDLIRLEKLVRIISGISNSGREVVLVSSGAIATGRNKMNLSKNDMSLPVKQACAAIGQAQLITIYQKLFAEYNQVAAQILLTKYTVNDEHSRNNAINTFNEILALGAIPIVNENDTVTTDEILFGDNDCLSALVADLCGADLLVIMSDIDGLYTDDPHKNPEAEFLSYVDDLDTVSEMGKGTGSEFGTGGMATKIEAARICQKSGIDMIIADASRLDNILDILDGCEIGTFFKA